MKILVINGTYRPAAITTELARSFMEGAQAAGAETEMIMLREKNIKTCTNCLKCYSFEGDGMAPCSLRDDMDDILSKIEAADGILIASPVHCGFITGLMTIFHERLAWRTLRPSEPFMGCAGMASRLTGKVRATGSIVNAGGMPERLRKFCDDGTPWLKSNIPLEFHAQWIGDQYAGADLEHLPVTRQDWLRLYFLRKLSDRQRKEAYDLGAKMARAIQSGRLRPVTVDNLVHPMLRWLINIYSSVRPFYRTAE